MYLGRMMGEKIQKQRALFFTRPLAPLFAGLILLSLFTSFSFASPLRGQATSAESVKVEYNEQKDITTIVLDPIILVSRKYEQLRLGAMASYKGRTRVQPKEVSLLFVSLSATDEDKYESARKVTVVADDQRLNLGEAQRSKQAHNGLFIESMAIVIPSDIFLRICWAKELTIKLGFTEVRLSADQITRLRSAASYMTQ